MAKILFIEDEPALQDTLGTFLKDQGHEVRPAYDGESGLEMLRREKPDILLLDLILPKMTGLEVFREMREDPALADVPVIVLTNVESNDAVEEAVRLGAKAYLVKTSYTLEEVAEKVRRVLDALR